MEDTSCAGLKMCLACSSVHTELQTGLSEVPVIQVTSSVLGGLRLMAQPSSWELNGAVGLQHPFSPQVLWGVAYISLSLLQRFIF